MSEIGLYGISKNYNPGIFKKKICAVSGLTLEIHSGQVFGMIGPNGAGKSTTIRMLLGLIRPDSGEIRIRGKVVQNAPIQGEVGYLPENPYLYDHLTLEELLAFSGVASGLSAAEIKTRGCELMEKLAMYEARKRPLRTFSKGMLQRAGICFALLHNPSLIILDEPMSGLDPVGRKMVFDLVTELKKKGKTVFFCSHILTDVERLCDRIGIMVNGRLVRTLERNEFAEITGATLHLLVPALKEMQRLELKLLVNNIAQERDHNILSVRPDKFVAAVERLQSMGIEVLGSRGERLPLEEIFMQAVEDNR